jgi:rhamnopyranosyl-N-acetylglucosaminyl-diphospho-decaprenol beta-1,3/1,4-galactofuranosyltransferase
VPVTGTAEPTVVAIVPTLNRLDDLRRCLDALDGQTRRPDRLVVVDNGSTDGTAEHVRERAGTEPVWLSEPVGAPAAFAAGMREAFDGGAALAWLMDNDAEPEAEALERLLEHLAHPGPGQPVAGVVPLLQIGASQRQVGWRFGRHADGGRGQSPNAPGPDGTPPHEEVDWAPFAGLLLRREACEAVGDVRGDFVLWHADVDYCLRLRLAGYRLLAAPGAVVRHPPMALTSRRVLGRTVAVGDYPAWREYYDTRNWTVLQRSLRGTSFDEGTPLWRRAARELARDAATLAAGRAGPRRVAMRVLGLVDGLRGRTDRRPERGTI